ncbi:hypothetical protein Cflav_PD0435 [Pedosphaera parvula Ellin514]|uniref:Type II secretion system protein GspG C-terminal domain-containing protein n=2 Tax=Pedosphaera TaxID=1032526 RepID=B9XRN3_PEDPL|nr:hypothetical protein Cflav_PD0435 [Pedosphaera parvula Ellin514]
MLPAVLVVMAGIVLTISSSGSRGKLRRYQAELRAKGEKLTFTELAIPPSTNAEQVASRAVFISPAIMSGAYATNSFVRPAPVPCSLMEFVSPGRARVAWGGELWLNPDNGNSSKTNIHLRIEWADFNRTNAAIAGKLEIYKQALEHPTPDTGWIYQNTILTATSGPPRTFMRDRPLAYGLVNAEIGELHRGNLAGAVTDLHALAGSAQLYRNEPMLVHQMARVTFAEMGLRATWEALQAPGWNEEQLVALQRDWEQVEVMEGAERGFLGTRAEGVIIMENVRRAKGQSFWQIIPFQNVGKTAMMMMNKTPLAQFWKEQVLPVTYKATSMDADELLHLRQMSEFIDTVRLLKAGRPWPEVSLINSNLWQRFEVEVSGDGIHSYWATAYIFPNLSRSLQIAVRTETLRRLAITAIALKRYELRHGHLPSTLAALVPEFLHEVPMDLMSGKPLVYRCNADSTFVLYSVGEDGKDDGGQGGMDLWQGADAVWPVGKAR